VYLPNANFPRICFRALGNKWRGKIEKILTNRGVVVKARKDIGLLIDEAEFFGAGVDEDVIWQKTGANIIIFGDYTFSYPINEAGEKSLHPVLKMSVTAYRISDSTIISADDFEEQLESGWVSLASVKYGNKYQKELEVISTDTDTSKINPPKLSASLDRKNACYGSGDNVLIDVSTETGVYLYIFSLAADHTVTLIYPNKYMQNKPLLSEKFVFPPSQNKKTNSVTSGKPGTSQSDTTKITGLKLYALEDGQMCRESFKIIASRKKLDFSFLPFPDNAVYAGAKGGDINKMVDLLKNHNGFSEVLLSYWVGGKCK